LPITTRKELHEHLETAIEVELSTVPAYLYAMYSIEDRGSEAALLLRSIVVEEMLHAALVTNLLLATGGAPDFHSTRYMPRYPMNLPHHDPPLVVDLAPCSHQSIERLFMRIEQPEAREAPAQPDQFETLGQFYHALEIAIEDLALTSDLFSDSQRRSQLSDPRFYRPVELDAEDSGGLVLIEDLASAIEAIEIIIHQGEGLSDTRWADPEHQELTHYYKLLQIVEGASPLGQVRPVPTNPRTVDYPTDIQPVSELFNAVYRLMYLVMGRIFSGDEGQGRSVGVMYILMADLLAQLGGFLVEARLDDGSAAAPTFEIHEFDAMPLQETLDLAAQVAELHPELAEVHATLNGLDLML